MGIYIKGMEMPPACNRCWNCDINTVDGTETEPPYACLIRMKFVEEEWEHKRPDWCPLVEIKPHGRLIDADKLRAEFPHPNDWRNPELAYAHLSGIWATIDCAETIIEAEDGT